MDDKAYARRVAQWRSKKIDKDTSVILALLQRVFGGNNGVPLNGLDYGCNDGAVQAALLKSPTIGSMVGVDTNKAALEFARGSGLDVRLITGPSLPFRNCQFDFVICLATLAHIPPEAQEQALREMWAVTQIGGVVVIETPNPLYDKLMAPWHWISGYRGDPTIKQKVSYRRLKQMAGTLLTPLYHHRTGRRLPGPFKWLPITSDYRVTMIRMRP